MTPTPAFPFLLQLIDSRSAAMRDAVRGGELSAAVPGCPDWSVADLVAHVGEVQRFWAAVVTAGPAQRPPGDDAVPGQEPAGDLMAWSAESTAILLAALTEAGPQRGCWTWWSASKAAETCRSVARHQVQEAAVHAFDAQEAAGVAKPLPLEVALDGVDEFLTVGLGSMGSWPHRPAQLTLSAHEGGAWLLGLTADGAAATEADVAAPAGVTSPADGPAAASVSGSASDVVLFLYGRDIGERVRVNGDKSVVDQLLAWGAAE